MKLFFCNKKTSLLFSLTFVLTGTTYLESTQPKNPTDQEKEHSTEELKEILHKQILLFNSIDRAIEDILILADSNIIPVKNRNEFIENTKAIRLLIGSITSAPLVNPNQEILETINFFATEILSHLLSGISKLPVHLNAFDIEKRQTRFSPLNSLEKLVESLDNNEKKLKLLKKKTTTAGLRTYNKIYRKFNSYVIEPTKKYQILTRTAKITGACAALWYIWYYLENVKLFPEHRKKVGKPFKVKSGNTEENNFAEKMLNLTSTKEIFTKDEILDIYQTTKTNEKPFAQGERFTWLYQSGYMPLAALGYPILKNAWKPEITTFNNYINDRAEAFHNFMMGGIYRTKRTQKYAHVVEPRFTFADVVGQEHAKKELFKIVQYLESAEQFDKGKLTPPKGYLLTGPTRTGKTYIAEALAGEIRSMYRRLGKRENGFNFFNVTPDLILQGGIEPLLAEAKTLAPCILFIDEIDILGLQRAGGDRKQLMQFLEGMSGCMEVDPEKTVIIIAATNRPENIDVALRQPGRFEKEIRFEYPSLHERAHFLQHKLGNITDITQFDLAKIAYETAGKSYEAINNVIRSALYDAIMYNIPLNQKLLDFNLDREVRNVIRADNKQLYDDESRTIAIHHSGKALASLILDTKKQLAKIHIRPYLTDLKEESVWSQYNKKPKEEQKKIKRGRIESYYTKDSLGFDSYEEKIKQLKVELAGHVAQKVIFGSCGYTYQPEDMQHAFEIAKGLVYKGLTMNQLTKEIQNSLCNQALELCQKAEQEIHELLEINKKSLEKIASALLEHQELSAHDIIKLIGKKQENEEPINEVKEITQEQ